jgi:beta-lactamase class A
MLFCSFDLHAVSVSAKFYESIVKLEKSLNFNGRIGVYAINIFDNKIIGYKEEERFPFCSTSKLIVVSLLLKNMESNPIYLAKVIQYNKRDVKRSGYAPVTSNNLNQGMDLLSLAKAAIEHSDNLAMNLIIKEVGGISEVNKFAKIINDHSFRLDRMEPELNTSIPNDIRDTTTPKAMVNTLQKLILGNVLNLNSKNLLLDMLKHNTTGATKIRSVIPNNWVVADKTGSGDYGTNNDIAIIYPFESKPIIIAIYTTQFIKKSKRNDRIVSDVAKLALENLLVINNKKLLNY